MIASTQSLWGVLGEEGSENIMRTWGNVKEGEAIRGTELKGKVKDTRFTFELDSKTNNIS